MIKRASVALFGYPMQRCWFGCRANKGASSEIQVLSDLRLLFPDTHPPCTHVCIQSHRHEYMAIKHSSTIYQRNNMCHMCVYVCMYVCMYKFMYVRMYKLMYVYLRRGGTKASACFLTRAGARETETPPHPYGMAQT